MGLRELLRREPKEFPVASAPDRVAFAEQRILELIPADLTQAFVDAKFQIRAASNSGGLAEGDKGMLQAAFLMGNLFKITKFIDSLDRTDKSLLDHLPSDRDVDPGLKKTLQRCGVSARVMHHQAAVMTLLEKRAASPEVSLAAESISRL